jgi:hypothetical protein
VKKIFTLLATIAITATTLAQAPAKMNYQAVVRNADNSLLTNQTVGIQISILQGSISGTAIYIETHTPSTNSNGLVSLEIGTGTFVSGTFATIDLSNGPFFIKTETDPNGGVDYSISGTSQLMSVPYALHANTADSIIGGVNITETDPVFDASIAKGITANDTANWNNHIIDTNTQLDSTGIVTLGFVAGTHTLDTKLDSTDIATLGFVAGEHTADTQLDSTDITTLGFVAGLHTTDTQLDSTDIASLGYVAGAHTIDTQLDSTGIAILGYIAGSHAIDTQLDSTDITTLGFVAGAHTTDTQLDSTGIAILGFVAGTHTIDTQLDAAGVEALGFVAPICSISIGDTYEGGIVFYLDATGCHGLISSPTDQSTGESWRNSSFINTTAFGSCVGCGEGNTSMIVYQEGSGSYAAQICADLTLSGHSDWYLPSKYELELMFENIGGKDVLGLGPNYGGFASQNYWSSTESTSATAWKQDFNWNALEDPSALIKSTSCYVRAIRAF